MAAFQRQPSPFAAPTGNTAVDRPPTTPGMGTGQMRGPSAGAGGTAQPRPQMQPALSPQGPYAGSPNPGRSGTDPRGRIQNQGNYQQQRFEGQVDPMMNQFAQNYGRGTEQGFLDYGRTMGQYGNVMDKFGQLGGPQGFGQMAQTGGYSPTDMANMRSRGVSPVRAAYANAEREVQRQRSLQGGYSPNATATLAKMAREQGQAGSDAATNVEAQLAQMKQQGQMQGLQGQLGAAQGQLGAAGGMAGLYGATPGMAATFGNQLSNAVNTSGQFGLDLMGRDIAGQQLPGQWDTTVNRINQIGSAVGTPLVDYLENRNKGKVPDAGQAQVPNPGAGGPQVQSPIPNVRTNINFQSPGGSSIGAPPLGSPDYGQPYQPGFGGTGQQQMPPMTFPGPGSFNTQPQARPQVQPNPGYFGGSAPAYGGQGQQSSIFQNYYNQGTR